ncbi:MAG: sodium-dependent transporter [Gammaproteobacteria bacterium]|nr:sodium-dependent transporter [Gammaproteobacteria bacterium]
MSSEFRLSMHGQWSGRVAFILAATGSAVGLGNIWKFPYITGDNGGGAFVLVYLFCIVLIGIPVMMAEIFLGRKGGLSPINTMGMLAREENRHGIWRGLGWMGAIAGLLILSYYSVIAGWAMAYTVRMAAGVFVGATADGVTSIFVALTSDPERLLGWHTLFMLMTMTIVSRGVQHGLEKAVRFLMPLLLIMLLILVAYATTTGAFAQGFNYLFYPDFSKLTSESVLVAMGHAFFTLSLGMGAIMAYGAYLPKNISIAKTTFMIAGADTLVALFAGLAIFPIVFANSMTPAEGPGLIFKTLPIAFGQMDYGILFGTLFFVLIVFAAWTSAISLIEPMVAWLVENKNLSRIRASAYIGVLTWFIGVGSVLSFNVWEKATWSIPGLFKDLTFFDTLDGLTANVLLPLGGLFIAIFVGHLMAKHKVKEEMNSHPLLYTIWYALIRYVTPLLVIIVFLKAIKLI